MIFQFLQNKLQLTSSQMHVLFIILMVLYLALQIIDRIKNKDIGVVKVTDVSTGVVKTIDTGTGVVKAIDADGECYILIEDRWYKQDSSTGEWHDIDRNVMEFSPDGKTDTRNDNNGKETEKRIKTSKPSFFISVVVSAIFGLAAWMLTMIAMQFMPEAIVGRVTSSSFSGELGRTYGYLAYQLVLAISFIGVIPVTAGGIFLACTATFEDGQRFSFTVLAGSILPFYALIYSIMPLKTDILFGMAALIETVLLVIGLLLETVFGGRFGFARGLLEYAVSFMLFSSLLTFPSITGHFFSVLGLIVVLAGAAVLLYMHLSDSTVESSTVEYGKDFFPGRMDYGDASYQILYENWDTMEVEDERGNKYTLNKNNNTWKDSNGAFVNDTDRRGLNDLSRFHGW